MITWMQKHKKWLVITIWISAIAFIGAGMVNWGSYGFGSSNDKVATVGHIDIHFAEYQRAYNEVYNEYSRIPQLGGILDEAQAKQLGLPKIALQRLIQQTQLLNFAQDLGLEVSDQEVSNEIINANVYVDDQGRFSSEIYKQSLRDRQMRTDEFEESIRKVLLIQKLLGVMNLNTEQPLVHITPLEVSSLKMASSIYDRLMVGIIPTSQISFDVKEDEVKEFWLKNASQWKTPMAFHVEYILVPYSEQNPQEEELLEHYNDFKTDYFNEDGHLMSFDEAKDLVLRDVQKSKAESVAKREYIALRDGKKKGEETHFDENDHYFIKNGVDLVVADMKVAQKGQTLRPIEADKGYVTLKILDKTESVDKSFDEARNEVNEAFKKYKRHQELIKIAQESISTFKGKDIGFVNKYYNGTIENLDTTQKAHFLNQVFSSNQKEGYVLFEDKAVMYRILEQAVMPLQAVDFDVVAKNVKYGIIAETLMVYLGKRYKTTMYIDLDK
ncbi:peptidylprolyl isomerase [Helicobacter sp. MIT 05-5293]|uniref:peptidylprolyl isomerase n=1 Tax=Helicobacter sp. MIT 05-5293 TaxID=1548149 RepID=UPI00051D5E7E|nr:peptidylprolyl isomerase [Helicobacter sp. MIT 05-5293]TLD80212.1 peptidylprolyl isomerase [Helicobacter sp. MIT 05-5293]